jgi:HTH-type transcriptional regulator/antitoxin HigA
MAIRRPRQKLPDTYFRLVQEFPLTSIRDDRHLQAAQAMIDRLLELDRDRGAEAYLNALTDLVETYEDQHEPMPDATEADVLRELIRAHGLSQPKLAKAVGISQSTLSAVLHGVRSLTKQQVIALAKHFRIAPAAFLPR